MGNVNTGKRIGTRRKMPPKVTTPPKPRKRTVKSALPRASSVPGPKKGKAVVEGKPSVPPTNVAAAEITIAALRAAGRLETIDKARMTAFRSLARAVDADPSNASLWREYAAAERTLREVREEDDTDFAKLLADLRGEHGP